MVLLKLEFLMVWILKSIAMKGKEQSFLIEICHGNYLGYQEVMLVSKRL